VAVRARRAVALEAARAQEQDELLRAIVEGAPPAVLMTEIGVVVMTNQRARDMFAEGAAFEGQNFIALVKNAPAPLREAMMVSESSLFTVPSEGGEVETFLLRKHRITVRGAPHVFLVVESLTREMRRQEVDVWKKLLRTISHELNNSLAPISSMVHSAKLIVDKPEHLPKLARVFDTIEGRTKYLQEFIDGYVHFARMPKPRLAPVRWSELLDRVAELHPGVRVVPTTSRRGRADAGQLEQVLINLVKNAIEAGSPPEEVVVSVKELEGSGVDLVVEDRGGGMGKEVMASALLPFYSTKERGTGLGLALCREVLEAHGGKIGIANREGGGLVVTCSLAREDVAATTRITLTRG